MKVLFAVNDEKSSSAIIKKYQKEYKEILSYKNVYYFNAILKELQKDKTYDKVVISEELEEFSSTSYEQQDRYIFEKLDNISDEASNVNGTDVPIIVICSDRRTKSEELLVKLFGIGIYNAIIGNDRSIDQVCRLLKKPRSKKEAKLYYKIDAEDVNYQTESENEVSEDEMQNILNHFSRLGKNEERYVESFNNIVSQYNDNQLRTIIAVLPMNVKAILETNSIEYQKLVMNGIANKTKKISNIPKASGPSEKLLNLNKSSIDVKENPIIVPTALKENIVTSESNKENIRNIREIDDFDDEEDDEEKDELIDIQEDEDEKIEDIIDESTNTNEEVPKRRRGRPRKNPALNEDNKKDVQRKRGRPRKIKDEIDNITLPGFEIEKENVNVLPGIEQQNEDILPGFEQEDEDILPGFEPENEQKNNDILPGFDQEYDKKDEDILPGFEPDNKKQDEFNKNQSNSYIRERKSYDEDFNISSLLSENNKIATFVGTSKNGTSFIVNNIAEYLTNLGVDTAILDTTKNKNSYYIYTKNEEDLRARATYSITNLINGNAKGIRVKENLTVYTSVPNQEDNLENIKPILETLVKNHSAILIDCDFDTPYGYFANAQEIYLVQSMDILTIQPLTAFLRELKSKNILSDEKIKIIINKWTKLKKVGSKNIIGGIAFYNDPEMSFMTELFNKDKVKYEEVPLDEDIYIKYLDGLVDCDISIAKYSKEFLLILKNIANMVYPLLQNNNNTGYYYNKKTKAQYSNGFSNSVNNTLSNMKKKY